MADPLSIAASIAGLVSLGGATFQAAFSLFNSITSIKDAPSHTRALLQSCNSLNVALGQVQRCLLSNEISLLDQEDYDNIDALRGSLLSCESIFKDLDRRVRQSGLTEGAGNAKGLKRVWKQIEWAFKEDSVKELVRRMEAEQATLNMVMNAFTMVINTRTHHGVQRIEKKLDRTEDAILDVKKSLRTVYEDIIFNMRLELTGPSPFISDEDIYLDLGYDAQNWHGIAPDSWEIAYGSYRFDISKTMDIGARRSLWDLVTLKVAPNTFSTVAISRFLLNNILSYKDDMHMDAFSDWETQLSSFVCDVRALSSKFLQRIVSEDFKEIGKRVAAIKCSVENPDLTLSPSLFSDHSLPEKNCQDLYFAALETMDAFLVDIHRLCVIYAMKITGIDGPPSFLYPIFINYMHMRHMSPDDLANSGHYGLLASGIPYMLNIVKRGVVFNDVKYDYMRIRSKTMRNLDALQREVDRISQTVTAKRILHLQKQVQQLQSGFELSKGTACHQNSPSGDQVKISKESLDEDRDREDDESAGAGDSNGANKDKSESSHPTLPVSPDPTPSTPPPHPMKSVKDKLAIPSAPQPIEPAVPIVPMKGRAYDDQFILRLLVEITILGVLAKILVMLKDVGGAQTAERK